VDAGTEWIRGLVFDVHLLLIYHAA
jgi:hypothetical protein